MKKRFSVAFLCVAMCMVFFMQSSAVAHADNMVWVTGSGTKYHYSRECSNMSNPKQVTLEEAKRKGYTACSKCASGSPTDTTPDPQPTPTPDPQPSSGDPSTLHCKWYTSGGKSYWYENGVRQGTYDDTNGVMGDGTIRGREICDMESAGWYWLDACYDGAKAINKEVWMPYIYQQEKTWGDAEVRSNALASGNMSAQVERDIKAHTGKWVRYDANGAMYKGWYTVEGQQASIYPDQAGNTYYYDPKTGLMAKGDLTIDGVSYHFDETSGVLQK